MATDAVPQQPSTTVQTPIVAPIKIATPELVALSSPTLDIEYMTDVIFEDIGGQELINISRSDIVNGQEVIYKPIKNISSIFFQYNPQNILKLQDTSATYFQNFPIRLENRVPNVGSGPNGEIVYMDKDPESSTYGNIIIDVINLESGEQVEVQILSAGSTLSDTIYEVNN
jgi:hypothetical protein